MADAPKTIGMFPATPRPDAEYTRRLSNLFGISSAIGRSIRRVLSLAGIRLDASSKTGEQEEHDIVDRSVAESFITNAERALRDYAGTQQNHQAILERVQGLITQAKEKPGSKEGVTAMAEILKEMKDARNSRNIPSDIKTSLNAVIQSAPPAVSQALTKAQTPQRKAA